MRSFCGWKIVFYFLGAHVFYGSYTVFFVHQGFGVFIVIIGGIIYVLVTGHSCCWLFLFIVISVVIFDKGHSCYWFSGVLVFLFGIINMVVVKVVFVAFILAALIVAV